MLEKFVLAAIITFSLNLFLHIREPGGERAQVRQPSPPDTGQTLLVKLLKDQLPDQYTDKD